ncbi:MAG: hypothetical protein GX928_04610 [Ruminococcaceae bacterium]|nr:hypothetical protein [Oscillospiraceae bacterium]
MDYRDYYEARDIVTEILKKDFLGPLSDDEIICDERPLDYYIVGKLYPQSSGADIALQSPTEDIGELDNEDCISLCNGRNPSSCGISFSLLPNISRIRVTVRAARYKVITIKEAQETLGFPDGTYKDNSTFWKREEISPDDFDIDIDVLQPGSRKTYTVCDKLSLNVFLHKIYPDGSKTITLSLVNENKSKESARYIEECEDAFFQPLISVTSPTLPAFRDIRRNVQINKDHEIEELEMLYSKVRSFASGHGCAVKWNTDEAGNATEIKTDFLPTFEIKQMMPSTLFEHDVLSMKYLSESSSEAVINGLNELTEKYEQWIEKQVIASKELAKEHQNAAAVNLSKCKQTLIRLKKAIKELKNPIVFRAFSLANKAMFMQRKQMLKNTGKFESDEKIKWYPFQLAFILQETYSFAKPDSEERKNVDLLWFPTGGGKTEAYLGIAAFVIFLRRLLYGDDGNGVAILMRYTLRLLSFQQFERAAALICACELIRRKEKIGGDEIGIGLWAGMDLTPNYIEKAKKILNGEKDEDSESSNPAQIKKCPWCGAEIPAQEPYYSCDIENHRMHIYCSNSSCEFKTGLPIFLIDEEIYHYKPTYIVATVDKFAQVALNESTAAIFGIGHGVRPPELIIQDELHLISGPLGTIMGLYEAAIKKLCEKDGCYPKVIASTATIRNANEQIKALYASGYTQFPPQGIDIDDSFFAQISDKSQRPARLYMGCMAIGTSPTTMMIRVMSALLYATRYLSELEYDEKVIDSFWTITGYFNTLRELGGAIVRVVDDIQDRFIYLKNNKFKNLYPLNNCKNRYDRYKELTSRESSENIGNVIQEELKIAYTKDNTTNPFDFLLASNMISVGVDVGRLGAMVVVGQPKSTAEYIQATSRVGRETPGLVITTYNQAKSRDRSHYEQFTQYHETFYKHVEATSVTPFSDRARDRALQALYVILCRYSIPELLHDSSAVNFKKDIPGLIDIRNYILNYVSWVDPGEVDNVKKELDDIENEWARKVYRKEKLKYRKTKYANYNDVLFDPDYDEGSRFRVLNTMRSVETTINVITKE